MYFEIKCIYFVHEALQLEKELLTVTKIIQLGYNLFDSQAKHIHPNVLSLLQVLGLKAFQPLWGRVHLDNPILKILNTGEMQHICETESHFCQRQSSSRIEKEIWDIYISVTGTVQLILLGKVKLSYSGIEEGMWTINGKAPMYPRGFVTVWQLEMETDNNKKPLL